MSPPSISPPPFVVPDDEVVTRQTQSIEEACAHAAGVASALQNLVRASSRRRTEIDLPALFEAAGTLIGGVAKRTEVTVRCADDLPVLEGDRNALLQALINLMQNSVDAIEETGRITLAARRMTGAAPAIEITVRDDGRGIPSGQLARVREAGFTTMAEAAGRGLGLTIVDRIVARHGGELTIESVEGAGTTVRIVLPGRDRAPDGVPSS